MREPAVEQYETGINPRLPCSVDHLYQNIGFFAQGLFTSFPAVGTLVYVTDADIGPVAGCMKCPIQGEKVQPIVKPQLQVLVAKDGAPDLMIEVVADHLDLLARLGAYRIVGDQHLFFQGDLITHGNGFERHQIDQLAPVEGFIVQKPVKGIFMSLDIVLQIPAVPEAGKASFEKRQQHECEQECECFAASFLDDIASSDQRAEFEFGERSVQLAVVNHWLVPKLFLQGEGKCIRSVHGGSFFSDIRCLAMSNILN